MTRCIVSRTSCRRCRSPSGIGTIERRGGLREFPIQIRGTVAYILPDGNANPYESLTCVAAMLRDIFFLQILSVKLIANARSTLGTSPSRRNIEVRMRLHRTLQAYTPAKIA